MKKDHLLMYWLPDTPIKEYELPEGYSVSQYRGEEGEKEAWVKCVTPGLRADFDGRLINEGVDIWKDLFFLDYEGEHVGTISAYMQPEKGMCRIHMVGIREDFRGKGLSKYLMMIAEKKMKAEGVPLAYLTTDEFRASAVKSYLDAGFLPVQYSYGMQDRWENVLEEFGIESVQMLYQDATPYKVIYRKSKAPKVRFGVIGGGRGKAMMRFSTEAGSSELVAVCDKYPQVLEEVRKDFDPEGKIAYYTDYDEFLKHDMDCVVLANYANQHAPFAIRAMKAGKHVVSEVLPAQTLKECVELIEAVQETGKRYFYAEDFCYFPGTKKMKELVDKGVLGEFQYGEGEYMHNFTEATWNRLTLASPDHWRNNMSAFFYCTHSLGPLIHISGKRPVSVTGFEGPFNARTARLGMKAGAFAVEMVTLENGAILKSLHGCGVSRHSYWYSLYGSKGRMETARRDAAAGFVKTLYVNCDENEDVKDTGAVQVDTTDSISDLANGYGHHDADYYMMYNVVQALRGDKNADVIDEFEAMDMLLPGFFAYRSALAGGIPMTVPDFRDPAEREKWRDDTACTDPAVAGNMLQPSYSKGTPEIPAENYARLKTVPWDKGNMWV